MFVRRMLLLLILSLLAVPQLAAAEGAIEKIGSNAYVLLGKSGNVVIAPSPNGVLLIDDERESDVEEIRAAVRSVAPGGAVRLVVNTHWHLDHSGGNDAFARDGAVIVAQRNVRARRSTEQLMSAYNRRIAPAAPNALPQIVFDDRLVLHVGDETVQLRHVPNAHTDGDTLVRFEQANLVHLGDVFFNGLFPFIDRDSGGSIQGLIAAVDVALAMSDDKTRVVPAHGDLTDKAGLLVYRTMLVDVMGRVRALLGEGKTLAQVQDAKVTAAYKLEGNAERFVAAVYDSLVAGKK